MATTPLGKVTVTPRGNWRVGSPYERLDVVFYEQDGCSYVCKSDAPAGTLPTDTAYWQKMAKKGGDGAVGPPGPQGEVGPAGIVDYSRVANALKKTAIGQDGELEISDVSPLEHGLKVRLLGENLLPWPTAGGVWTVSEYGWMIVNKDSSSVSTKTIATFEGETALPVGRYTLICADGTSTQNGVRAIRTKKDGTTYTIYAYGETQQVIAWTEDTVSIRVVAYCNVTGETTLSPVFVYGEEVPNYYIAPTRWETVTVYCAASQDAADPQSATPDEDGFVSGLTSLSPSMALWCDGVADGAGYPTILCTYSRDINVAYEELINAIIALGGVLG